MRNIIKKRGQVWVETVIYTLIALALIGLVLTFATPRIAKARDRAVVEQTIASLNEFDKKIGSAIQTTGNVRAIDFTMKRGELFIKSEEDKILFVLQEGEPFHRGRGENARFELSHERPPQSDSHACGPLQEQEELKLLIEM